MPKFTWITIFLSIFITVVVTEVVINEYTLNQTGSLAANVSQTETNINNENDTSVADIAALTTTDEKIEKNSTTANDQIIPIIDQPSITETILTSAKIANAVIKEIEFNGQMFDFLKIDFPSQYIIQQNIFSGQSYIGLAYEIHFQSPLDAEEYYMELKNKSAALDFAKVNENNSFGEKSFYINNKNKENTVFLICKVGTVIYGFNYPHSSHAIFKSIVAYFK
ncbi:MAG: hypothetical protein UR28_C0028G0013 [Candidatus Peregrinibacteria bacterium GW2011_GWF2_33_10]|nr:MAG: hypothetical protein UR28_C0028G0013 [Candidatus Peregrinibacteria bacterium GW2011_GWF2_33_10]OGJ44405.1 MAG: hypothetical protein A2272_05655 [Candidatus Peregrinibacteria bacterium RIFOXYA12_FULL_33_12]OGJ45860.1 MAG: hypothetical protein A2263_03655 [Candidatus Peregrinibacteria bacterium RIFOXYA2_FULL_33_21]OGJ51348.1 MAG: hypothetical protein A2307_02240 [Candidatus Peregrinibacteria bacterium RIFOXYB2_FULL_33_20]